MTLDEDPSEGRVAKLLSSSPQATSTAATKLTIKNFFKAINNIPALNMHKYTLIFIGTLKKIYL